MNYEHDDFDTHLQPEDLQCDNPIDEGSDRDNWEDNQVFLDNEGADFDDDDSREDLGWDGGMED